MPYERALVLAYGVELFPASDELATELLSAGLLPMVGPQTNIYPDETPLCSGLPTNVRTPLESGDSLELVTYKSVGLDQRTTDQYQIVTISLIGGLSESEYLNDITKIRTALDADLRCSTQIGADNGELIESTFASFSYPGSWWTLKVNTGDNGWGLTRVFVFQDEEILCTTKSDSIGFVEATTQVRIGTMADEEDVQYGAATYIYYLPSFEFGLVIHAVAATDQWLGSSGDSTVWVDKALTLANVFSSSVTKICARATALKEAHDMGYESDWSPTLIPKEL